MDHLPNKADEDVISFDLNDIFPNSETQMEELEAYEIPDEVLREILDNTSEKIHFVKKETWSKT